MTWTATVNGLNQSSLGQEASCTLTDGVSKLSQSFTTDGTIASLKAQARTVTDRRDAIAAKPDLFVGLVVDLAPDQPPPPPSDAQKAQDAYFSARRQVSTLRSLLALGRKEITQQMVDDAATQWNATPFIASYEGLG